MVRCPGNKVSGKRSVRDECPGDEVSNHEIVLYEKFFNFFTSVGRHYAGSIVT